MGPVGRLCGNKTFSVLRTFWEGTKNSQPDRHEIASSHHQRAVREELRGSHRVEGRMVDLENAGRLSETP